MPAERHIKKYANRRLYDSTGSRHVTLEDIRRMIVSGETVRITDDKSTEDLTRAVLLQVISEQEQFGTPVLSTDLLETIIRFHGNPIQELLSRYMESSVGALLRQQQSMRADMVRMLESTMGPNMNPTLNAAHAAAAQDSPAAAGMRDELPDPPSG